jgi:hypothetical protein
MIVDALISAGSQARTDGVCGGLEDAATLEALGRFGCARTSALRDCGVGLQLRL